MSDRGGPPPRRAGGTPGPGSSSRPNILWICADDYAPYVSGTYGNPLARTPNLDRLAAGGIRFDRAYCTCPLSTPSRMSFLTGRYPRSVGVTLTPTPLPPDEVTIGRLLGTAGYETLALGKTHYYEPLAREFERCVDLLEHGAWLAARPPEPAPPTAEVLGPWRPFRDPARVWLNADGLPYAPDADMPDTFFAELARRFLGSASPRSRPFFLWVGFYVTHAPFRFPIEFAGRFDPSAFRPPAVSPAEEAAAPPVFLSLTDDDRRGIAASYYTSVEYLDRNVGLILDALDRSGHAEDTLVVFNSDHGYLLGQHGRFEKHCCFEEAVRTALIVRCPWLIDPGRSTDALVELIDLVPTLLDFAGAGGPGDVQGRSLVPLLAGLADRHRDHVIAEYADNAEAMVRTDRWKLIYSAGNRVRRDGYALSSGWPGRSVRLFDLRNDPAELVDLSGRADHARILDDLLSRLVAHVQATSRESEAIEGPCDPHALLEHHLPPFERRR
ncbi:Arylsulfatase [Aquisphaera giovannonii]|uniref:Arylsulfatase n=1 Tax=Aquisphaera giovannonii TaxID=406548 RepID=A0A5B9W738_9BACT|nr:sulfatase-like hydrolase/transferase [Aquisphaera giovannonii]QEH35831.1 Arylsulfatase [Aquisphaera giovannonii]